MGTTKTRAEKSLSRAEPAATIRADFDPLKTMLANYAPILIFLVVAGALSIVLLALGFLFRRGRKGPEKLSSYQCGV